MKSLFGLIMAGIAIFKDNRRLPVSKLSIFLLYLKLTLRHKFFPKKKNITVNIFGFQVRSFSYKTIKFLFYELYIKKEYFIKIDAANPLIVDCGANIGMATLFFKLLYPKASFICIEPNSDTFNLLSENMQHNNIENVTLVNSALMDYDGTIKFYYSTEQTGSLMMSAFSERMNQAWEEVNCRKLSDILPQQKVDILKMDIEGAEHLALKDLIDHNKLGDIDNMLIEYHHLMDASKVELGGFLSKLEEHHFAYQVQATYSGSKKNVMQDIGLFAYRIKS
ncbi:MAG: FkbM family methyltransferase [Chitinophagaceae bacterium]|nr:FkbM family methyltransferase [Chitinophagaceae bacterium]